MPIHPPVYPIGRLDKDSEGLILLTNDGKLAQELTHPSFDHKKVYMVHGTLMPEQTLDKALAALKAGIILGDGPAIADEATGMQQGDEVTVIITVHEGRFHLLRRMCGAVGINVFRLTRTQIGSITLGSLKPGKWRMLTKHDLEQLT